MSKNGKTKVIDKGHDKIIDQYKKAAGSSVDIGIMRAERYPNNVKIKGKKKSTADEKRIKYRQVLTDLMWDVTIGRITVKEALELFGERVVGDVKRKITSIRTPPNAPRTVSEKGFDNPLIRTGTLRSRIKKRVNL